MCIYCLFCRVHTSPFSWAVHYGNVCVPVHTPHSHTNVFCINCSSPHLVEVRERIRINGQPIGKELFTKYFWQVYGRLDETKVGLVKRALFEQTNYLLLLCLHLIWLAMEKWACDAGKEPHPQLSCGMYKESSIGRLTTASHHSFTTLLVKWFDWFFELYISLA